MNGAVERPFDAGRFPIRQAQVDATVRLCADLCETYDISVTPETVLTHAEVQDTLGIAQRWKWDITWLPGFSGLQPASVIGNDLRRQINDARYAGATRPAGADRPDAPGLGAVLAAIFNAIFGGKT